METAYDIYNERDAIAPRTFLDPFHDSSKSN